MSSRDHLRRKKKHKNNLARSLIDKQNFQHSLLKEQLLSLL
ncbi:hypothetical protein HMPREF1621_03070 [Escherichia coli A25922R]|nr:hypothetical protein HMPREF1593_02842 [Escherichia coli 907391]ESE32881.1 hypothetical protein HMPREF1621_03070 [Escherichia coli A25922R]